MGRRVDDAGVTLRRAVAGLVAAALVVGLGVVAATLLAVGGPSDRLSPAFAGPCPDGGRPPCVTQTTTRPPGPGGPEDPGPQGPPMPAPYQETYVINCHPNTPDNPGDVLCGSAINCPDPAELRYRIYRRFLQDAGPPPVYGEWEYQETRCINFAEEDIPPPEITPAMILEEIRGGLVPSLDVQSQPVDGRTAVNFDTIFYTEPVEFADTIPFFDGALLVEVRGEPLGYRWVFGDGATDTSSDPGAPYPNQTVTHQYLRKGTFDARVDVTYGNFEYSPDGGATWYPLAGAAIAEGTPSTITVSELPVVLGN